MKALKISIYFLVVSLVFFLGSCTYRAHEALKWDACMKAGRKDCSVTQAKGGQHEDA